MLLSFIGSEAPVGSSVSKFSGLDAPQDAVVLASSQQIVAAVDSTARAIAGWMNQEPKERVTLLVLLQGGKFYADRLATALVRVGAPLFDRFDLKVSTRHDDGSLLSKPEIGGDLETLRGKKVLVVDDILDSGRTLRLVLTALTSIAAQVKSAVLLQKDAPGLTASELALRPKADFVGLTFQDSRWLSGAGMDMPGDPNGLARNAPYVIAYPPVSQT